MSKAIVEQIAEHIEQTLQRVSVAAGFDNDLTVQRFNRLGTTPFDRLVVIHNGEIEDAGPADTADRTRIGLMMAGHDDGERPAA